MKSKQPKISIGMPVWNGEDFIGLALDSLLAQDFKDFEIILSDNASTDNTEKICEEYTAKDKRIRYIRQEKNIGVDKNFNFVLDKAEGEYFMWAAYDDLWEPSYISEMVKVLDNNKSVIVAFCFSDNIDKEGEFIRTYYGCINSGIFSQGTIFKRVLTFLTKNIPLPSIYGLMRTQIVKKVVGEIFNFKKNESNLSHNRGLYSWDVLVQFQLLFEGDLYIVDGVLFHYRLMRKDTDIYLKSHKKLDISFFFLLKFFKMFIDVHGYFTNVRNIIFTSKLNLYKKYFLWCISWLSELKRVTNSILYYFSFFLKFVYSFKNRKEFFNDAIKYNPNIEKVKSII